MPPGSDFATLLRHFRQASNLTLERLGERSGVSARAISDMERARSRGPQARTVEALADALNLSASQRGELIEAASRGRARPVTADVHHGLPAVDEVFEGRSDERSRVAAALAAAGGSRPVVVSGPGGIGKTTLVVRGARDVAAQYSGAPTFVGLGGASRSPSTPAAAAAQLLVAHDMPEAEVPRAAEDRFSALADMLSARRGLLVLDDVHDEAQVRPLLRHRGGTAVVLTSRRALGGLDAADRLSLAPMTGDDAVTLLTRILGDQHDESYRGLDELADICGRFPLALRIAANRLLSRPGWSVQTMIERLSDQSARLGRLRAGDVRIETAFEVSYGQLRPVEQLVFRRMGLATGRSWSASAAAMLTGLSVAEVDDTLDELVELELVTAQAEGRYGFHDLLRLFAVERLERDDRPSKTESARIQYYNWLLVTAADAGRWFEPDQPAVAKPPARDVIADRGLARRWLLVERENWFAALQAAAAEHADHSVIEVAEAMHWFSDLVPFWPHWYEVFDLARLAAQRVEDLTAEATHTNYLAWCELYARKPQAALDMAVRGRKLAERAGDPTQLAWAQTYISGAYEKLGENELALAAAEAAADTFVLAGDTAGAIQARHSTVMAMTRLGRYDRAIGYGQETLALVASVAGQLPTMIVFHARAACLTNLGEVHLAAGRSDQAVTAYTAALEVWREGDFGSQQARGALRLAAVLASIGRNAQARDLGRQALRSAETHEDQWAVTAATQLLDDLQSTE